MALENNGTGNMVMPVGPMSGNGGGLGGDWGSWIILFLIFGMFGGGWGNGMNGGGIYPWLNQSDQINNGFQNQMLGSQVMGLQNSVTAGFGDIQTALCGGFASVNATVNGAQNALAQQMYANQIAELERSFAAQTAVTQGMTGLQGQLAQCCCDNRLATCQTQNIIQTEAAATRSAIQAGVQSIHDVLCQDKIDAKNEKILELQNQLNIATFNASQIAQTAQIIAGVTPVTARTTTTTAG